MIEEWHLRVFILKINTDRADVAQEAAVGTNTLILPTSLPFPLPPQRRVTTPNPTQLLHIHITPRRPSHVEPLRSRGTRMTVGHPVHLTTLFLRPLVHTSTRTYTHRKFSRQPETTAALRLRPVKVVG